MFADQVIEYMQKMELQIPSLPMYQQLRERVCSIQQDIRSSQKFFLGDVQEFLDKASKSDKRSICFMDLDDIRMPFPVCWFSYTVTQNRTPEDAPDDNRWSKAGVLVREIAPDLLCIETFTYYYNIDLWGLAPLGFFVSINRPLRHHPVFVSLMGDEFIAGLKTDTNFVALSYGKCIDDSELEKMSNIRQQHVSVVELALQFLNCKNIGIEGVYPSEKLNKKRQKKGKQELFTYHTLVLKPVGKTQRSVPQHLWENRIHLQRGHFKTYTNENPLFGKIVGRFWWQSHVRGRNRDGMVIKDYEFDINEYSISDIN
jgi:hypothetical protein